MQKNRPITSRRKKYIWRSKNENTLQNNRYENRITKYARGEQEGNEQNPKETKELKMEQKRGKINCNTTINKTNDQRKYYCRPKWYNNSQKEEENVVEKCKRKKKKIQNTTQAKENRKNSKEWRERKRVKEIHK